MSTTHGPVALGAVLALLSLQCSEQPAPKNASTPTPEAAPLAQSEPTGPRPDAQATTAPEQRVEPAPVAASPAADVPDARPAPLNDAQIGAVTEGANGAEVEQGKLARSKSKNQKVQQFASMMVAHHSEAQKKQAKLKLSTAESPLSTQMTEDANKLLTSLKEKSGPDFDRAYMRAQVDQHQALLETVNTRLLPNVTNAELKAYLEEIKTRVEQHLDAARTTEAALTVDKPAVNRPGNAASMTP